jgi:hypothetical protein
MSPTTTRAKPWCTANGAPYASSGRSIGARCPSAKRQSEPGLGSDAGFARAIDRELRSPQAANRQCRCKSAKDLGHTVEFADPISVAVVVPDKDSARRELFDRNPSVAFNFFSSMIGVQEDQVESTVVAECLNRAYVAPYASVGATAVDLTVILQDVDGRDFGLGVVREQKRGMPLKASDLEDSAGIDDLGDLRNSDLIDEGARPEVAWQLTDDDRGGAEAGELHICVDLGEGEAIVPVALTQDCDWVPS